MSIKNKFKAIRPEYNQCNEKLSYLEKIKKDWQMKINKQQKI